MNEALVREMLEKLAKDFNTTVEFLVPRLQQYNMAMCLLAICISGFFILFFASVISAFVLGPGIKEGDSESICIGVAMMFFSELIPVIICIINLVEYVGWKYAPEIKMIEYVRDLIK